MILLMYPAVNSKGRHSSEGDLKKDWWRRKEKDRVGKYHQETKDLGKSCNFNLRQLHCKLKILM